MLQPSFYTLYVSHAWIYWHLITIICFSLRHSLPEFSALAWRCTSCLGKRNGTMLWSNDHLFVLLMLCLHAHILYFSLSFSLSLFFPSFLPSSHPNSLSMLPFCGRVYTVRLITVNSFSRIWRKKGLHFYGMPCGRILTLSHWTALKKTRWEKLVQSLKSTYFNYFSTLKTLTQATNK